MAYIYDDSDNSPMNEEAWQHQRQENVKDRYGNDARITPEQFDAVYNAKEEPLPFTDPPDGCWNCMNFDWNREACTTNWNNMDESYYNPDIDDRKPEDHCEYWELNPDAKWEDWHDG